MTCNIPPFFGDIQHKLEQLMWVYEGRLAWERSSSTYPDGHLISVQVLERGILCFLFDQLGFGGQSQGNVGVSANTLWMKKMAQKGFKSISLYFISFSYFPTDLMGIFLIIFWQSWYVTVDIS